MRALVHYRFMSSRVAVCLAVLVTGCAPDAARVSGASTDGGAHHDLGSSAPTVDCTTSACAELSVAGEGMSAAYGNPKVYRDPNVAHRSWLIYSAPKSKPVPAPGGGAGTINELAVDTHLAVSDDDGMTWTRSANLWPAALSTNAAGDQTYFNSEVASLASVDHGATTTWFGLHMNYLAHTQTGYSYDVSTMTLRIATADGATPEVLANAPAAILGYSVTNASYGADVTLNDLDPGLKACFWNNPALHYLDGKLYVIAECMISTAGGGRDAARSKIAIFSTQPTGVPSSWSWRYVGTLADATTAAALGVQYIQQPEIAVSATGGLLAIVSRTGLAPGVGTEGLVNHGCAVIKLASLDPPRLATTAAGQLDVAAILTADGGACTYEASLTGGMIVNDHHFVLRYTGLRP